MPSRLVQIATVGAAHGVRGEVRVKTFTEDPSSVRAYGPLTDAAGTRSFVVESVRPVKAEMVVVRLKGVTTREAAEALNGIGLFVERERLPAPRDDDDFYHADLIGLAVETVEGARIGEVVAVQNFGADDLLEVRLTGARRSVLLPFTKAVVPTVDVAGGRVTVDPPDGALDAAEPEPGQRGG